MIRILRLPRREPLGHRFQREFSGKKKEARYCHSIVNPCLIQEGENIPILEKLPMDELHIMEGIINHIFFKGLVIKFGKENAMKWPKKVNVVSVLYTMRKILKEIVVGPF